MTKPCLTCGRRMKQRGLPVEPQLRPTPSLDREWWILLVTLAVIACAAVLIIGLIEVWR